MPELYTNDSSNNIEEQEQQEINIEKDDIQTPIEEDTIAIPSGLTQTELNDPNAIVIEIADQKTPIVVFFGPRACGKTMTLIRLTRYLKKQGYKVNPIETFRPSTDTNYKNMCNNFNDLINNNNAAKSTNSISFMLVDVRTNNGRRICQILEAPGEYYFDDKNPQAEFPAYVNKIKDSNNRKIWTFMLEPNWMDLKNRRDYVDKIAKLKKDLRPRDRAIFLYNKVDKTDCVVSPGQVPRSAIFEEAKNNYEGIFEPFRNQNPITRFFSEYRFDLVPFQTGSYAQQTTKQLTFTEGVEEYPRRLWNVILKRIRG